LFQKAMAMGDLLALAQTSKSTWLRSVSRCWRLGY
jgi:hypothetical protein